MIATLAATLLLAPIPPAQAFTLPSAKECVGARSLDVRLRAPGDGARWKTATVKVDGTTVKRLIQPARTRTLRLRKLPLSRFTLTISARTDDGRSAKARRTYTACPQGDKPVITIPEGPPPATLVTRDLRVGTGAVARARTTPKVHYVLVTWSNRKEADSSWKRGAAFEFPLGRGFVIPGFEQAVEGMRVGGRREVIVPPALGYGEEGLPPDIAPNETLVFVIDLIAVKD